MNKTDERIAEIYRRSEIIFKKRKQNRKVVFIACVPTVLCAAVIVAHIFSAGKEIAVQNDPGNVTETTAPISIAQPTEGPMGLVSVHVLGPTGEVFCNQENVLTRFQEVFDGMTASADVNLDVVPGSSGIENTEPNMDYRFVLTDSWGHTTEYVLKDSILVNEASGEVYIPEMTDIVLLFEILGISFNH